MIIETWFLRVYVFAINVVRRRQTIQKSKYTYGRNVILFMVRRPFWISSFKIQILCMYNMYRASACATTLAKCDSNAGYNFALHTKQVKTYFLLLLYEIVTTKDNLIRYKRSGWCLMSPLNFVFSALVTVYKQHIYKGSAMQTSTL